MEALAWLGKIPCIALSYLEEGYMLGLTQVEPPSQSLEEFGI